jgi:hypothetical protein
VYLDRRSLTEGEVLKSEAGGFWFLTDYEVPKGVGAATSFWLTIEELSNLQEEDEMILLRVPPTSGRNGSD